MSDQKTIELFERDRQMLGDLVAAETTVLLQKNQTDGSGDFEGVSLKRRALMRGAMVACGCARALNSHNHTFFSVLDGVSSPEEMVSATARRGWHGFGISDHGSMGGNLKAGAAAKRWKTARLKDGRFINFEEIKVGRGQGAYAALFDRRALSLEDWSEVSEEAKAAIGVLAIRDGVAIIRVDANDTTNSLIVADQSVLSREVPVAALSERASVAISGVKRQIAEDIKKMILALPLETIWVTYSPQNPVQCRILNRDDVLEIMPFTVVSGVELYVSWEKDKGKRYNHITCYATGQKGHEALVLLTSLGSISSRRYVGEGGFYRPRVFVEDIEKAAIEADGELVVTTGCPISITSEALRRGDRQAAEDFFDWATRTLPKGRFFAELHLCDVSLDYNRNHKKADGKFYSSIFGVPCSRLRHESEAEALSWSSKLVSELNDVVLCEGASESSYGQSVPLSQRVYDSEVFSGDDAVKPYVTTGVDQFFRKFNVNLIPRSSEQVSAAQVLAARSLRRIKEALEDLASFESLSDQDKKKISRKRGPAKIVDEETAATMDSILKASMHPKLRESPAARLVLEFAAVLLARILDDEDVRNVNPSGVVFAVLEKIAKMLMKTQPGDHAEALLALSSDRMLYMDLLQSNDEGAWRLVEIAAAGLLSFFSSRQPELVDFAAAGKEDEIEKEFIRGADGNWMVRVNQGLAELARRYDVPLLIASDAHMASIELKPVQDALLKNGERRRWHFSRPYAVASVDIASFCAEAGRDYSGMLDCESPSNKNAVIDMLEKKALTITDIIESFGSGSLLLDDVTCVSKFKWQPAPPKIDYRRHPLYLDAKELLDSGVLRDFLPKKGSGHQFEFSDTAVNIATALLVVLFFNAVKDGDVPDTEEYLNRMLSELYLQQELPPQQLADFFLVLQFSLKRFRDAGVSVGPGRGSSGGMLTAFISGITFADPIKNKFLESRWMNRGRKEKGDSDADIDIDVDNRQLAGHIFAQVAKEAVEADMVERPLSPLEAILLPEIFYSSPSVSHGEVASFYEASQRDEETVFDSDDNLAVSMEDPIIFGSPIVRVGTYQSLKAKAAVKEAIRMMDNTRFEDLPSFGVPTSEWLAANRELIVTMTEDERNIRYEEDMFSGLSMNERIDRRRVRLAEQISEEMKIGSGMARLYSGERQELDYFMGSVYGVCPEYWDHSFPPPSGSVRAARYFDKNPHVKAMAINFLNIYKNVSVHAGGFCIGREILRRIPLRVDKHGFVSQYEMKDIEKVRVLKFDILGLKTLTLIKESLRMWVDQKTDDEGQAMFPADVWRRVRSGESTDYLWRYLPLSTEEAVRMMCKSRSTIFQIDTKVYGKELDRLDPKAINAVVTKSGGDQRSIENLALVDILSAFLALFRPGPMKSNSHSIYIDRLLGAPYEVKHAWMAPYVKDTFGVIAYQEQVMIMTAAGMMVDPSEAEIDEIRRAMGKKQIEVLKKMRAKERFAEGLMRQGVRAEDAHDIWAMIEPFAEYGFNLPHSYHYGVISAVTLWSKAHNFQNWFKTTM